MISNALKFTEENIGVIYFIVTRTHENLIDFSIQDNGLGMSKKNIDNLGKMFFTHNSENKNNHGIGLKMYISSKLIKM